MDQTAIFLPMFGMFLLTFVVWVYMYARRIPFITSNNLTPEQLTPAKFAELQPPEVSNPSDNLKNLFELPVVFYAVCLYLYAVGQVDTAYVWAAWLFLLFRVLHSIMHCSVNVVIVRFWLYAIACVALWFMVIRAGIGLLF